MSDTRPILLRDVDDQSFSRSDKSLIIEATSPSVASERSALNALTKFYIRLKPSSHVAVKFLPFASRAEAR